MTTNHMHQVFLSRAEKWQDVNILQPAKIALTRLLKIDTDIRAHHAATLDDKKLSLVGRHDSIHQFVVKHTAMEIHRAGKSIATMREQIAKRRAKLQPPTPDKDNPAAIALRGEMRTMLRGMANGERSKLLMAPDADPTLLAAVLEAVPVLTKVDGDLRKFVTERMIEKAHPGALALIEQATEAADLLDAAHQVVSATILKIGDFQNRTIMTKFLEGALSDTKHIDAAVERDFSSLADAA